MKLTIDLETHNIYISSFVPEPSVTNLKLVCILAVKNMGADFDKVTNMKLGKKAEGHYVFTFNVSGDRYAFNIWYEFDPSLNKLLEEQDNVQDRLRWR